MQSLAAAVGEDLDVDVREATRVGGGDVAESYRMELADGRTVFAKTHRDPPAGFFTTEANGLRWLHEPAVLPVPEVLAVSDGGDGTPPRLVLEWIDQASSGSPGGEAEFGRALGRLHRAGSSSFGREDRRTTGSLALPNDPCATWVEFYGERRLGVLLRIARDRHCLPTSALTKLERTIGQLDVIGGPVEPPARLHGDLWAGNRLVDRSGRSWLIDPACHGGHREYDLAMMRLFGGFGPECFAGYLDEWPLADGWEARIPLHQLAPLVVHAVKFGGGYAAATERALDAVLRSDPTQGRRVGAMPPADDATRFEAAGLFDPADAIDGRLELLRWLVDQGFTIDEMLGALAAGRLSGLPSDRRLLAGPLLRRDEAIAATALEVQDFEEGVRAFGFSGLERSPQGEIGVTAEEASAIATFTAFGRMFTSAEAHAFFRVIGSSIARIADAAVSLFLADVESRSIAEGESELELARKAHDAAALLDGFTAALDPILRRHVMQAIERSRRTTISMTERLEYRYAIGFVDLVGFTQIAGAMASHELAGFLRDFEARAHDAATAVGARVVKMIGDEVMFVSSDASSAVAAGDALMDGLGSAYEHIVPRGALAYGDMLVRGGDYFGSVVNLASRLVDEAMPHELLVTEQLASAVPGCEFAPAGRRMLKGFADPVVVLSFVR